MKLPVCVAGVPDQPALLSGGARERQLGAQRLAGRLVARGRFGVAHRRVLGIVRLGAVAGHLIKKQRGTMQQRSSWVFDVTII